MAHIQWLISNWIISHTWRKMVFTCMWAAAHETDYCLRWQINVLCIITCQDGCHSIAWLMVLFSCWGIQEISSLVPVLPTFCFLFKLLFFHCVTPHLRVHGFGGNLLLYDCNHLPDDAFRIDSEWIVSLLLDKIQAKHQRATSFSYISVQCR